MNQFGVILISFLSMILAQQSGCLLLDQFPQEQQKQEQPRVDPRTQKIEGPSSQQNKTKEPKKTEGKVVKTQKNDTDSEAVSASRLNVLLKNDADPAALANSYKKFGLKQGERSSRTLNQWIFTFDSGKHQIESVAAALQKNRLVESVTIIK